MAQAVELSTPYHCLLYQNRRGRPIRTLARVGLAIASSVLLSLGWACWRHAGGVELATISGTGLAVLAMVGLMALIFAWSSWRLGQHYVLHFEVWPRSHLAILRTAGIWEERVQLISWAELQASHVPDPTGKENADAWIRVRLTSGRVLIFDHQNGVAPQSWAALNRFLQKRSLPVTVPDGLEAASMPSSA